MSQNCQKNRSADYAENVWNDLAKSRHEFKDRRDETCHDGKEVKDGHRDNSQKTNGAIEYNQRQKIPVDARLV